MRPPVGERQVPVKLRFIDGLPIVTRVEPGDEQNLWRLTSGDGITTIDGSPVGELVDEGPIMRLQTGPAQLRDTARFLPAADAARGKFHSPRRPGDDFKNQASPVSRPNFEHDLRGTRFRLLSCDVAHLKLSSVKAPNTVILCGKPRLREGFIIDMRNREVGPYPTSK